MGLLSSLQRAPADAKPGRAAAEPADEVQQARTRARRRLIGAVLLLGVGVIGFPLLFETQPRPIPVDIAIDIPRKEGAARLPLPPPKASATASGEAGRDAATSGPRMLTETAAEAGREVPPPTAARPAEKTAEKTTEKAPDPARDKLADKPAEKTPESAAEKVPATAERTAAEAPAKPARPPTSSDAARARALLEGGTATTATARNGDEVKPRYIVQVGAFADEALAREARGKVERLGLKTYTQVVQADGGRRIRVRVGPFASRDEAAKAAERLKSAGLATSLLTL